jgi:tripartite-type tricarboxylate transporter receptor subunit TctC
VGEVWRPTRGVQIVAGTPPGGGLDRVARALAKAIVEAKLLDVSVGVVNVPGDGARRAWTEFVDRHPATGTSSPSARPISSPTISPASRISSIAATRRSPRW